MTLFGVDNLAVTTVDRTLPQSAPASNSSGIPVVAAQVVLLALLNE